VNSICWSTQCDRDDTETLSMTVFAPDIPGSAWRDDNVENAQTHALRVRVHTALTTAREATGRWTDLIVALDNARTDAAASDWDGDGGHSIIAGSYSEARRFLELLPDAFPSPLIGVDADGEVTFEWIVGAQAAFSISVSPSGDLANAGLFGLARVQGREPFGARIPRSILTSLQRLSALT
jgi:hypothetical protein